MSDYLLHPKRLSGSIDIAKCAPSKSIMHREMICSYLSGQEMPKPVSDDTSATYNALLNLQSGDISDVGESASTLRFLIPLALHMGGRRFSVHGNLANRPLDGYSCIKGAKIARNGNIITVTGCIKSGDYTVCGDISSQFVSGLLFTLPLLDGDSSISFAGELQSKGYADMTMAVLRSHGIHTDSSEGRILVCGNQSYRPADVITEGDTSYAAFFHVANYLGAEIRITGDNSLLQPDRRIHELLGCDNIDISQTPDLFPALCVAACGKKGKTRIFNAKRLRIKECDRLSAMAEELKRLGANIIEYDDSVEIEGLCRLHGGEVFSHNDHRIAMALTIAALCLCDGEVLLHGAECVKKSVPDFFMHIEKLSVGENV